MSKYTNPYKPATKARVTTPAKKATTPAAKPVMSEAQKKLAAMIAAQSTARYFGEQTYDGYEKQINFVTAANGVFRVEKTNIGLFKTQISEAQIDIPGLDEMQAGVELIIPKIPFKYLLEVLQWYKDIHKKDGTEASVLFFWNHNNVDIPKWPGLREDGQLIIYVPIQTNSAGLSDFTMDENVDWLRQNTSGLLETHSH